VYESADDSFAKMMLGAQLGDNIDLEDIWQGVVRSEWYQIDLVNVGLEKLAEHYYSDESGTQDTTNQPECNP
jgi:hypothetical protein